MEKTSTQKPLPNNLIWAKIIKPYETQMYAEEYIQISLDDMEYVNGKQDVPILEKAVITKELILMFTGEVLVGAFPTFSEADVEEIKGLGKRLKVKTE